MFAVVGDPAVVRSPPESLPCETTARATREINKCGINKGKGDWDSLESMLNLLTSRQLAASSQFQPKPINRSTFSPDYNNITHHPTKYPARRRLRQVARIPPTRVSKANGGHKNYVSREKSILVHRSDIA